MLRGDLCAGSVVGNALQINTCEGVLAEAAEWLRCVGNRSHLSRDAEAWQPCRAHWDWAKEGGPLDLPSDNY